MLPKDFPTPTKITHFENTIPAVSQEYVISHRCVQMMKMIESRFSEYLLLNYQKGIEDGH